MFDIESIYRDHEWAFGAAPSVKHGLTRKIPQCCVYDLEWIRDERIL